MNRNDRLLIGLLRAVQALSGLFALFCLFTAHFTLGLFNTGLVFLYEHVIRKLEGELR